MARKRKKSKAKKKVTRGASSEEVASVGPAEDSVKPDEKETPKESAAKKKAAKKKTAKKETAKKKTTKKEASTPEPDDEEVVVIDLDDAEEGVAELLAEAIALDEPPEAPIVDEKDLVESEAEAVVVEDLDATLDEDEIDDAASRERLIAEALAFVENEGAVATEEGGLAEALTDGEASEGGVEVPEAASIAAPEADQGDHTPASTLSPEAIAALEAIQRGLIAGDLDDGVLDLGDVSDPDERDRLLASAMAHAEMQEARYRVPTDTGKAGRGKGTISSVIFLFAMLALARPPGFLVPELPARLSAEDHVYGARVALLLQAQQIEAFRAQQNGLPASLGEVDARLPGIRYIRSSSRLYQLIAYSADGEAIVYDSANPDPEFVAVRRGWMTTRDDS